MLNDLVSQIGYAIHHCGALEFLVNNAICSLAKDELLSSEVVSYPFYPRINLLRKLLSNRSNLIPEEIKSLCQDLSDIAKTRNRIAHNPIVSDSPNIEDPYILIIRNTPDNIEKMFAKDVKAFVKKRSAVMQRLVELLAKCVNCERS